MKNIEKFKEVFGFEPEVVNCLSDKCSMCPLKSRGREYACYAKNRIDWWYSEYDNGENCGE